MKSLNRTVPSIYFNIKLQYPTFNIYNSLVEFINYNKKGFIYLSIQILAFADDIDIIARSQSDKETFTELEKEEKIMQLKINEEKTKYNLFLFTQKLTFLLIRLK